MKAYEDKELLRLLRSTEEAETEEALTHLYGALYKMTSHYIQTNSGDASEVEDIFQDAMIVLYNQVRRPDFEMRSSISTYFYSICRNLWLKRLRKSQRSTRLTEELESIPVEETQFEVLVRSERTAGVAALLQELSEDCQKLLHYFYYERLKIKQIVVKMNISGEAVAKNKKSNCMKQLRKLAAGKNWL